MAPENDIPLYDLLPLIVQYRDAYEVGEQATESAQGNLKKIVSALENELDLTQDDIDLLATLLNADTVDPQYLAYLAVSIGNTLPPLTGVTENFQRWLINHLVDFHKAKGTHRSWVLDFQWVLGAFRDGWELWKTIPHEVGDYEREQTYSNLLKAARIDIYTTQGDMTSCLMPTQAEAFMPLINRIRPIHVLLRRYVKRLHAEVSLGAISESVAIEIAQAITEEVAGPSTQASLAIACLTMCEVEGCQVSCETACEEYCELQCQTGCQLVGCQVTCEDACQMACEGACEFSCQGAEENPCDTTCNGACEAGICQMGCQYSSCQAGCQTQAEAETFPAHVVEMEEVPFLPMSACNGPWARVWFPFPGSQMPPTLKEESNWAGTDWWITPSDYTDDDPTGATRGKMVWFDPIGDGYYSVASTGGRRDNSTLSPRYWIGDWDWVRCVQPDEFWGIHEKTGNSIDRQWTGHIPMQPHPGTYRLESSRPDINVLLTEDADKGLFYVTMQDISEFEVGETVVVQDTLASETQRIVEIDPGQKRLLFDCALKHSYAVARKAHIARKGQYLIATSRYMLPPVSNVEWKASATGDIDPDATNWFNYRGDGEYEFDITWSQPPKKGAVITAWFVPEKLCRYSLLKNPCTVRDVRYGVVASAWNIDDGNSAIITPCDANGANPVKPNIRVLVAYPDRPIGRVVLQPGDVVAYHPLRMANEKGQISGALVGVPYAATGQPFAVTLSQTGGDHGDESNPADWTYTVSDADTGAVLGTNVSPVAAPHQWRRPSAGYMLAATFGYAHRNTSGDLVIGWINEVLDAEACGESAP